MFSTPVLGSKFLLQDAEDKPVKGSSFETDIDGSDSGELVLIPPSIGMSTSLLNRDHYTEYYEGMPSGPDGEVLRRHGDEVEFVRSSAHLRKENKNAAIPYFRALGRSDDTMNIGGKMYIYRRKYARVNDFLTFSCLRNGHLLRERDKSWKCRD